MKKLFICILIFSCCFCLSGCGVFGKLKTIFRFGEAENLNYGVTAQQWLSSIEQRAKQWKGDAYFYGITETQVNLDGASDKWVYLFYSPGSEKEAAVTYEAGFISLKEVSMPPLNPVKTLKIDSPTALNLAGQNGGNIFIQSNQNYSIIVSLAGPRFESSGAPKWLIKYYGDTQTFSVLLDATNGTILQKN